MSNSEAVESLATAFVVERYLPHQASGTLAESVARVAALCAESAARGSGVQYLQSVYLPSEDTCFCVFLAPSADAVRQVNGDGEFAFDRITTAMLLNPATVPPQER